MTYRFQMIISFLLNLINRKLRFKQLIFKVIFLFILIYFSDKFVFIVKLNLIVYCNFIQLLVKEQNQLYFNPQNILTHN